MHTGRSRNDQTVTDTRLWLRKAIHEILATLVHVIERFVTRAECEKQVILPGYTHLQRAQPVRWSHWLLRYWDIGIFRLGLCRITGYQEKDIRKIKMIKIGNYKIFIIALFYLQNVQIQKNKHDKSWQYRETIMVAP